MTEIPRRSVLIAGLGVAGAALAKPYLANAAATTVTMWWNQGFYAQEDAAFQAIIADWEKASGNKAEITMLPGQALNEKIISALTSGQVPDLMYADNGPGQIIPQAAWHGQLIDVSDVVETQKNEFSPTALESAQFYDLANKRRAYYGVPFKGSTLNIPFWASLVEKAGYKVSEMPDTWDKFFDFFKPVQKALRKQHMRHAYGLGYTMSTTGDDPNNTFNQFLVGQGGGGIVTPKGELNTKDPQVREAFIKALEQITSAFKEGYVPPSALNWADPDNNNAFHAKEVVMTPNDTISISAAVESNKQWFDHDIRTATLPHDNQGKPVPVLLGVELAFIPKAARNIEVAKDFLKYLIVPAHLNGYLKQARGRWLPVMPSMVHNDKWWTTANQHVEAAVRQGVLGPTMTWFYVFNPAWAQVDAEHLFSIAESDIINGMTPAKATDKAFARMETIFSQYSIHQA
jgi:multiple sugar transport system substrate-binding protein